MTSCDRTCPRTWDGKPRSKSPGQVFQTAVPCALKKKEAEDGCGRCSAHQEMWVKVTIWPTFCRYVSVTCFSAPHRDGPADHVHVDVESAYEQGTPGRHCSIQYQLWATDSTS